MMKTKTTRNANPPNAPEVKVDHGPPAGKGGGFRTMRKARGSTVTIRDVARESGVSTTTVSVVLSNALLSRQIPATTKARIQKTAEQLGYRPNAFARSLRRQESRIIGVMLDLTSPYCGRILRGVQGVLYDASYLSILMDAQVVSSRNRRGLHCLIDHKVDGLIALAGSGFPDPELFTGLDKSSLPFLVIGSPWEMGPIPSTAVDEESGAYAALGHLHSLGHRKIAFIRSSEAGCSTWSGVCRFAGTNGLELNPRMIADTPASPCATATMQAGYDLTKDFLDRKESFTALVTYDDLTAYGAIRALSESGIRVPAQCSVLGMEERAPAGFDHPSLTTVRYPGEALGATAADLLLQKLRAIREKGEAGGPHASTPFPVIKVTPELLIRESTGPVRCNHRNRSLREQRKRGFTGPVHGHMLSPITRLCPGTGCCMGTPEN
jgi:LacI family transcriptional regulator